MDGWMDEWMDGWMDGWMNDSNSISLLCFTPKREVIVYLQ